MNFLNRVLEKAEKLLLVVIIILSTLYRLGLIFIREMKYLIADLFKKRYRKRATKPVASKEEE